MVYYSHHFLCKHCCYKLSIQDKVCDILIQTVTKEKCFIPSWELKVMDLSFCN